MGRGHRHVVTESPFGSHTGEIRHVTWIGLFVNLALTALKFIGGFLGGSQAVIADAVHSLSDMTTDVAILVGVKYWSKPPDANHPHGHMRLETVVTLGIGVVLAFVGIGLLWHAVKTLSLGEMHPPGWIAFAVAIISIFSKEILYRWTVAAGERIKSMPLIANAWHHRSDALSSIPAALAVAAAAVGPGWSFIDLVGAAAVSLFILQASLKIAVPAFSKLLDSGTEQEGLEKIRSIAEGTKGVKNVHGIRTRYIGSCYLAVDLHIEVEGSKTVCAGHFISEEVKHRLLKLGPDIIDVIVHLEPFGSRSEAAEKLA